MTDMWFQKKRQKNNKEMRCPQCGLECFDPVSLKRHIDWAHKDAKPKI